MEYYQYGEKEMDYLKAACPIMKEVIENAGFIERKLETNLFKALISSIVSQQISLKAAATVYQRLEDCAGAIEAGAILAKSDEELKSCGMSYRKVGYLKGICEAVSTGNLNLESLVSKSDEEVIGELIKLNGIGIWSAEMFMIFSLKRPDILSYGDLMIRNGIMKLYGLEKLSKKEFQVYRERFSPYGTVASIYLWKLAHQK
jgi:DNA-3-methyladenine glycosylase II